MHLVSVHLADLDFAILVLEEALRRCVGTSFVNLWQGCAMVPTRSMYLKAVESGSLRCKWKSLPEDFFVFFGVFGVFDKLTACTYRLG